MKQETVVKRLALILTLAATALAAGAEE